MQLVLTVEKSPQQEFIGTTWQCGSEGGTLGRSGDCDLVLPDPKRYTSSLHAVIEGDREGFRIIDQSTNGTYHNSAQTLIGKNRSVALDDGDRLYLGDFVLRVNVEASAGVTPPPGDATEAFASDAPSADSGNAVEAQDPAADQEDREDWDVGEFSLPWEGSDTAPGKDRKGDAEVDDQAGFSQSPEREYFAAPSLNASRGDAIPDDWDDFLTGFHDLGGSGAGKPGDDAADETAKKADPSDDTPAATPPPPSDQAPGQIEAAAFGPEDDEPSPEPGREAVPDRQASSPDAQEDDSAPGASPEPAPQPPPAQEPAATPQAPRPAPQPPPAQARPRPQRREPAAPEPSAALAAGQHDEILRVVTEGLMALLQGRSEIKNEFRIEQTRFVQAENNPLKFSPNADEALKRVLGHSEAAGFLTGVRAYQDALEDLQAHQLAILSAVQRAIESVIRQFDPEQLEARLKRISPLSAKTPGLRAAKCWNLFTVHYDEVAGKMREDARQLFMAEFGEAYEDACRQIVASRGDQSRCDQ